MKSNHVCAIRNGRSLALHLALFAMAAASLGLGMTNTVAASSGERLARPAETAAPSCQSNLSDHLAVCCAYTREGKAYFRQLARKDCRRFRGAEVAKSRCPARPRSDDPKKGLVCCQFDKTPGLGARTVLLGGKSVRYGLTPAERCTGSNKPVKRSHCVKKTTRRERIIACNKRKGWVWKNNRCQRESVRDKRDPRELECRKRGRDWAWRDGKCQRAFVRDKRNR